MIAVVFVCVKANIDLEDDQIFESVKVGDEEIVTSRARIDWTTEDMGSAPPIESGEPIGTAAKIIISQRHKQTTLCCKIQISDNITLKSIKHLILMLNTMQFCL